MDQERALSKTMRDTGLELKSQVEDHPPETPKSVSLHTACTWGPSCCSSQTQPWLPQKFSLPFFSVPGDDNDHSALPCLETDDRPIGVFVLKSARGKGSSLPTCYKLNKTPRRDLYSSLGS